MAAPCPVPTLPAPTPIRLERTPKGWLAFSTIFKAQLGAPLRLSLQSALASIQPDGTLSPPADLKQAALYAHIHDRLIIAFQSEQDLHVDLLPSIPAEHRPALYLSAQKKLAGQSVVSLVRFPWCVCPCTFVSFTGFGLWALALSTVRFVQFSTFISNHVDNVFFSLFSRYC